MQNFNHMMNYMQNPYAFSIEAIYTLIIVILCTLIFFKTKEIYDLTKYKGLEYFRITFLFFGLAYLSRFLFHIYNMSINMFLMNLFDRMMGPIIMMPLGYLSTMAIFYLTYSNRRIWNSISYKKFLLFSNLIAIIISIIAYITRSPIILAIIQLSLVITTILLNTSIKNKKKKKSNTKILYILISIFWLINIFITTPKVFIPFELRILFEIISVGIFAILVYKIFKWIK